MLSRLKISNYALIDSLDIEFGRGLSIVTGETGAGKSIMLGALSLLLGGRADTRSLRSPERKAVVEAVFANPPLELSRMLEDAGIEWDAEQMIVRREISPSGRSRAFVNDSPVTLQLLSSVTPRLIDIHSQHHNLQLADSKSQLRIIDAMAGDSGKLEAYRHLFSRFVKLRNRLEEQKKEIALNRQNRDFLVFQLEQLDRIKPRRGELERIEKEFDIFSDASEIKENLDGASALLGALDSSAVNRIAEARSLLGKVDFSLFENEGEKGEDNDILQRLESIYVELKDVAETIESMASDIHSDPVRLKKISDRMNLLYEAQKRFKVDCNDALVDLHENLRMRLDSIDSEGADLSGLEKELRALGHELKEAALELSGIREKAAAQFSELLTQTARNLGLPNLRFSAMLTRGKIGVDGMDSASFLCSFNRNQELRPLESVASGGEISRLMLSLKEIMSSRLCLPTVIFDEIDTGVSGEIADRMGAMMARMGESMQVMAITHLPQVASKGEAHYHVFKTDEADSTVTKIARLTDSEREREIARMLSGHSIDEAALKNARSLLGR